MIPLFKTHSSVGKALMQPERVVELAVQEKLERLVVVEDNFYAFRILNQLCLKAKMPLVFGVRLPVVSETDEEKSSKLIFFAKNNDGVGVIKSLYTQTYTREQETLIFNQAKPFLKDVMVAVPFYDSFVYNNIFHFGMSHIDLEGVEHFFIEEDNRHPFDFQIKNRLDNMGVKRELCKSVYYENKSDFEAFQMLKAVCGRANGKTPTFDNPNLEHCCSQEFSFESWKNYESAV